MVAVVVHPEDSSVDGKQRPVQSQRHGAVEVLPLLFGHLKDDLCRVLDAAALRSWPQEQFNVIRRHRGRNYVRDQPHVPSRTGRCSS